MQKHTESRLKLSTKSSVFPPSKSTSIEDCGIDELWHEAFQRARDELSDRDLDWISDKRNQNPFTSTQILEAMQSFQETYFNNPLERLLARIDPIVSHISSFAGSINAFTTNSMGVGMIWGSIYLVLTVASKAQRALEKILDFLSRLSPLLALFSRWHNLFPKRSFAEVGDAIRDAYIEIITFSATAVRHLRRNPIKNVLRAFVSPGMEKDLQMHEDKLLVCTRRVREEVDTAHMQFVQEKLSTINSFVDFAPTPRYMELPCIRLIPHSRNERFFGRQSILNQMKDKLLFSGPQKQRRFALSGVGGAGKTQIALEYTYLHLEDYRAIIWILADSPEKISQGFEDAAEMMGMPRGTQGTNQTKAFVLQRLATTKEPYLLCLDNADDLSLIKDCLPRDNLGSIVLTSRDSAGSEEASGHGVLVQEFSIEEGCEFLNSMLVGMDMANAETRTVLAKINTAFHGYPLALAQVAAFIRNGGCSLAEFLDIFQDKKNSKAISSIPVDDYHTTLSTVWDLSFQRLPERSRQIIEILVYFDPDSIPRELLEKGCKSKPGIDSEAVNLEYMASPVELWAALKGLRGQSLIRTNHDLKTISIHRFLQAQAFESICLEPSRQRKSFEEALFLLSNFQPEFPNVTQHWSPYLFRESEMCRSHIQWLARCFLKSPSIFSGMENRLGRLIFECASYQFERFHHHAAAKSFALARSIIEKSNNPNEIYLSDCYRMEGRMFNESGQAERGAESNQKAHEYAILAISNGYIGKDDQRMPRILTGLGNSFSQLRKFNEAFNTQMEAKKLCGDTTVDKSDAITIVQLNLGFLLYRIGDTNNAEKILRATLEDSPRAPPVMYALGNTLLAQTRVEEAIATHLKGMEIYIEMFGDQHALVGRCAYKVGEILLLYKSDPKVARMYLRKAIKIYLRQESPYYTVKAYARAARMLAKAYEKEGRHHDAKPYFEKAWALRLKIDGVRGSSKDKDTDYTTFMFYWDQ